MQASQGLAMCSLGGDWRGVISFRESRRRFLTSTTNGFFAGFMMLRLTMADECLPAAGLLRASRSTA